MRSRWLASLAALACLACGDADNRDAVAPTGAAPRADAAYEPFLPERHPRPKAELEQQERFDFRAGYWQLAPEAVPDDAAGLAERLEALGYASGTMEVETTNDIVRRYEPAAFDGVTLIVSGHAGEATLVDMAGRVLHSWHVDFERVFPARAATAGKASRGLRKAELLPDGRLLAIWEGQGLVLLSRDSEVLWKSSYRAHHDVRVFGGDVYVLTREVRKFPDRPDAPPYLEDFVSIVDLDTGVERRRVSLLKALRESPFAYLYVHAQTVYGDLLHTNSVQRLDGSAAHIDPAFRDGNVLVSTPLHDFVGVLDMDTELFVWAHVGGFMKQHDAQILDGRTLLMLDNRGVPGRSRAIEYDLATREPVWSYGGSEAEPLDTPCCGAAQRLPNGNTLITETEFGRAVEVTVDGDVVWEFINPNRAGPGGKYIAVLFEARRYPAEFVSRWLSASRNPARAGASRDP